MKTAIWVSVFASLACEINNRKIVLLSPLVSIRIVCSSLRRASRCCNPIWNPTTLSNLRMDIWCSLCSLYLLAWQVRVTVGDSGLCCVQLISFERLCLFFAFKCIFHQLPLSSYAFSLWYRSIASAADLIQHPSFSHLPGSWIQPSQSFTNFPSPMIQWVHRKHQSVLTTVMVSMKTVHFLCFLCCTLGCGPVFCLHCEVQVSSKELITQHLWCWNNWSFLRCKYMIDHST